MRIIFFPIAAFPPELYKDFHVHVYRAAESLRCSVPVKTVITVFLHRPI